MARTINARCGFAFAVGAVLVSLWMPLPLRAQFLVSGDPLPSWNEGAAKRAILTFVREATAAGGRSFVAPQDRIAVFDSDGTLWSERPLTAEVYLALARVKELAAADPSLRSREPFATALAGEGSFYQEASAQAVAELVAASFDGMSQEDFAWQVRQFLMNARHPTLGRPFTRLVYQPMQELLKYLRANGFQTWISSSGTMDFIRVAGLETFGVPPERTIGTELKREIRQSGGSSFVYRMPASEHLNDKEGKALGIDRHIGQRPVLVVGNIKSGGDVAMLEYSKGRRGASLQLLINHNDAVREFAYGQDDVASLVAAKERGFTMVNMKEDWRTVFPW